MRFCEFCGAALEEGEQVCSCCGEKVPEENGDRDPWAEKLNRPEVGKSSFSEPEEEPVRKKPKARKTARKPMEPEELPAEFWEEPVEHRRVVFQKKPAWTRNYTMVGLVIFILVLLITTLMFRYDPTRSPITQLYYGRTCTVGEKEYPAEGDWVELDGEGRATVCLLGQTREGTWEKSGRSLVITCGDDFLIGSTEGGLLQLSDGDKEFVLSMENTPMITEPVPQLQKRRPSFQRWEGSYYGWWRVSDAWGVWEDSKDQARDVCGWIRTDEDGKGSLELWDTDCAEDELLCAADLEILPGVTDTGRMVSGTGRFCDFLMEPGHWDVDPGLEPHKKTPYLLRLGGSFAAEDSGFSYEIYLMPWGFRWDRVEEYPMGMLPRGKKLPPHYADWYLPLIEGHYRMPDSFLEDQVGRE